MNSFIKNNWYSISIFNIIVIYIVGVCGICCTNAENQKLFLQLTPINIVVTTLYLLAFHKKWNAKFNLTIGFVFLFGFFIEVIGIKTQAVFGTYFYGETLGVKLFDVPLMMGFNWLLLVYCIAISLNKINNLFLFSFCSALVMTVLDFLIEPVAMKLDFWQWKNDVVSIQNYVAWFILSLILFFIFRRMNGKIENKFAKIILVIQFVFFGLLNLFLK